MDTQVALKPLMAKLRRLGRLDGEDEAALTRLPWIRRPLRSGDYVVRQGGEASNCTVLVHGFATRDRMTTSGTRQISGFHLPGDLMDLGYAAVGRASDTVQVLGDTVIVQVVASAFLGVAAERPAIARLLWLDSLIDASITREWTLNLGRRDARTSLLHLLCEVVTRQGDPDISDPRELNLPLTQEQLGDALGLTAVHVNRVLQSVREDSAIERVGRTIRIKNWRRLRHLAQFDDGYLRVGHQPSDSVQDVPGKIVAHSLAH